MPRNQTIKKVLVIGSGPIVIGQAAEFDYAGTQACRVLKGEGINTILVNSNPATIMTDNLMADEIYLEPLNIETIKRIIQKEHPDCLLAGFGGQTGLTIAMKLAKEGFLEKENVRLIGTNAEAIDKAEDRQLFTDTMNKINQPVIPSDTTNTIDGALEVAERIGYPVIVRPAFTLGGGGGGVAYNAQELRIVAKTGLDFSPITQILVEKYIFGWKEVEFEVMRDSKGNAITVCSMENVDPVGIHTGDSIVVAPALTLSPKEYNMLKTAALNIIEELEIEGGCNCQFALDPVSMQYAVIEVNPRVSRSSALASKATGYPIAKVATKIALGYTLDEIINDVTGKTYACFEPAIDYLVVKMPKWPFDKFVNASRVLGTQMKATGEVMAIGDNFESALLKAIRGVELSVDTLALPAVEKLSLEETMEVLAKPTDLRVFQIYHALKLGVDAQKIHEITRVDMFFINKIKNLCAMETAMAEGLDYELYCKAKKNGYTDRAIESLSGVKIDSVISSSMPRLWPSYKMVDTCACEFAAQTPYFYSTFYGNSEAGVNDGSKKKIVVLGSGPIRIGQGIEFDYSSVHCASMLKDLGYEVIIINNNPETVSTDFDISDRLYFEPLTPEDVMGVLRVEKPVGVVVAFGGQTAIKLVKFLDSNGITILGTSAKGIDTAEDRELFDALLEEHNIKRPVGISVMTKQEAFDAASSIGYPVLLRPSYVIGGQNMTIAYNEDDVSLYMDLILAQKIENPVLVDKYMSGTEVEVDVISDGIDVFIPGVMEHIERTGVHSGDSIAMYPPQNISDIMLKKIESSSIVISKSLGTKGLLNIQYLICDNELYVIEVNPRASRTIPYISKVTGVPMVDVATKVMLGQTLQSLGYGSGIHKTPPYVAVKVPVFSFEKLSDVNSVLGPEMKSTGEVLGIGKTLDEALFKGLVSAAFKLNIKRGSGVFITVCDKDKFEIVKLAKKFDDLGLKIYATKGTADVISELGIDVEVVNKLYEDNSMIEMLESGKVEFLVYTGKSDKDSIADYIRMYRRALQLGVTCITSLDTANALANIIASKYSLFNTELIDINNMRSERLVLDFVKMQGSGDDYIFFNNFDGHITCPESLSITMCDRHYGIGGDGIVLIEKSETADCMMRVFNKDGSEGTIAGNSIRCVGKYLYDYGYVSNDRDEVTIETRIGIKKLKLYIYSGKVASVSVDLGKPLFSSDKIPVHLRDPHSGGYYYMQRVINYSQKINDTPYIINCLSLGNPHCVIFKDRVDAVDIEKEGTAIELSPIFPEKVNVEFVRVVNSRTLKMRVWERGNGETLACGTGACAAAIVAVENGYCEKNVDITVKLPGGDLIVNYSDDGVTLTGNAQLVYEGKVSI